jgi:hypothetical protein
MFFTEDTEFTKHGYYQVDNIKTFSKFEAWQLGGRDVNKLKFIYNDDVFSKLDWTKEPEEDIYELYRQRAQQLREKYDYIVLVYSGGVDSHTALESFMHNGIRLDEILTFANPTLADKNKSFNQEALRQAVPFAQAMDLGKLNMKFRFVDIGKLIIDYHGDKDYVENIQYYNLNKSAWYNTAASHALKSSIPEHMALTEKGKKVCYLWGLEKPVVSLNLNYWCVHFIDMYMDIGPKQYRNRVLMENKFYNFYDEAFYICREFPKISIKQGHLLVNHMKTLNENNPLLKKHHEIGNTGPYVNFSPDLFLPKKMVDSCIYPHAILDRFVDDKMHGGSALFSGKDNWFYKSNNEVKDNYLSKMQSLISQNQEFFKYRNDKQGNPFVFSMHPTRTRPYPIAKKTS